MVIYEKEYKNARNKSWDILIKYNVNSLPVDVFKLCKLMNIKIYSYTDSHEILATFHLEKYTRNNDGFYTIINNNYVIFYDKKTSSQKRITFTIAHEIEHIVLGHLKYDNIACLNRKTIWNKGESNALNQLEATANIFTSRILSPSCVLWEMKIRTISEIQNLCNLSFKASEIRKKD